MGMFRKREVVEALMWHGDNFDEITTLTRGTSKSEFGLLHIKTPEGDVIADIGDMVVYEGQFVCRTYKRDVFYDIYEELR